LKTEKRKIILWFISWSLTKRKKSFLLNVRTKPGGLDCRDQSRSQQTVWFAKNFRPRQISRSWSRLLGLEGGVKTKSRFLNLDQDFSIVKTSFLKLSRFSWPSILTFCQCQDQESRSRSRQNKSWPPGLVRTQNEKCIFAADFSKWISDKWKRKITSFLSSSILQNEKMQRDLSLFEKKEVKMALNTVDAA